MDAHLALAVSTFSSMPFINYFLELMRIGLSFLCAQLAPTLLAAAPDAIQPRSANLSLLERSVQIYNKLNASRSKLLLLCRAHHQRD